MSSATALRAVARGRIGSACVSECPWSRPAIFCGGARWVLAPLRTAGGAAAVGDGGGERPAAEAEGAARGASIRPKEAAKFAGFSDEWWDPSGPFAPLHAFNPIRAEFVARSICDRYGREFSASGAPLAGLRVLDVGCGGGILAHTLAHWGASVVGVDVNAGGIEAARRRAERVVAGAATDLRGRPVPPFPGGAVPHFRVATVETIAAEIAEAAALNPACDADVNASSSASGGDAPLASSSGSDAPLASSSSGDAPLASSSSGDAPLASSSGGDAPLASSSSGDAPLASSSGGGALALPYHAVVASEVIEHVSSPPSFSDALADATLPGGAVVVTTMNRTPEAYALCIFMAEKLLRWVPEGTHDWKLFWTPEELCTLFERGAGLKAWQAAGFRYDPIKRTWSMGDDLSVNYGIAFVKPDESEPTNP